MIAHLAEEPLTKVTLNLFTRDVEDMKRIHGHGYTEVIRRLLRQHLNIRRQREALEK